MSLLQVQGVSKVYGGLRALSDITLAVEPGEFAAIIGPNGAGKSTLLNVLTGLVAPNGGSILFDGQDITRAPTHRRIRAGMGRTFQHGRPFARLSVLENVMAGAAIDRGLSEAQLRRRSMEVLERMGLAGHAQDAIGALSYGRRRMVELCRALACGPRLLLLDEPAAGLNSGEVDQFASQLIALRRDERIAIVLIEHNMGMVMRLAERIFVLNFGSKIAEGTPSEVQSDPAVLSAYLGEGYRHAGV